MVKGRYRPTWYSVVYTGKTRGQKRFTILEATADWREHDDTAAHYAAIRCPRQQPIRPAVHPADIPPPQSATLRSPLAATYFPSR